MRWRNIGVPSVSDPHEAIHGDLNQQIKIGEAIDEDKEDYENWKRGTIDFVKYLAMVPTVVLTEKYIHV